MTDEHAIRYIAGGGWLCATHPDLPTDLVGYGRTEAEARAQLLTMIAARARELEQQAQALAAFNRAVTEAAS